MKRWFKRWSKRKDFAREIVAQAVRDQRDFEAGHPVEFAADQRRAAVLQRAHLLAKKHGAKIIPRFEALVNEELAKIKG